MQAPQRLVYVSQKCTKLLREHLTAANSSFSPAHQSNHAGSTRRRSSAPGNPPPPRPDRHRRTPLFFVLCRGGRSSSWSWPCSTGSCSRAGWSSTGSSAPSPSASRCSSPASSRTSRPAAGSSATEERACLKPPCGCFHDRYTGFDRGMPMAGTYLPRDQRECQPKEYTRQE